MKKYSHLIPSISYLLLLDGLFSLAVLAVALLGQYGFGLYPCHLCILQRIPYTLIALVGCCAFYFIKSPRILYWLAVLCAVLFLIDAGIAFYHAGVESGFFPAPDTCANGGGSGEQTLEEMRAALLAAPLVSCTQAMIYIFGLSMAAWNGIAAIFAFLVSLYVISKKRIKI